MKTETLRKIIIVLIAVLFVSLALAILLSLHLNRETPPDDTAPSTAESTPPAVETVSQTEETSPYGPPVTAAPVTEPPVTDAPVTAAPVTAPLTTDPPETDPPYQTAPAGFTFTRTVSTETGVKLDLRAVCEGKRQSDGSIALTVSVYLDHRSLYMGGRTGCKINVGPYAETFSTEPITRDEHTPTSTLLYTLTGAFAYQDVVDLYIRFPARVTYSEKKIEYLTIEESFALQ